MTFTPFPAASTRVSFYVLRRSRALPDLNKILGLTATDAYQCGDPIVRNGIPTGSVRRQSAWEVEAPTTTATRLSETVRTLLAQFAGKEASLEQLLDDKTELILRVARYSEQAPQGVSDSFEPDILRDIASISAMLLYIVVCRSESTDGLRPDWKFWSINGLISHLERMVRNMLQWLPIFDDVDQERFDLKAVLTATALTPKATGESDGETVRELLRIESPLPTSEDDADKHIQAILSLLSNLTEVSAGPLSGAVLTLTTRSDRMMLMGRGADIAPSQLAALSKLAICLKCEVVCIEHH